MLDFLTLLRSIHFQKLSSNTYLEARLQLMINAATIYSLSKCYATNYTNHLRQTVHKQNMITVCISLFPPSQLQIIKRKVMKPLKTYILQQTFKLGSMQTIA